MEISNIALAFILTMIAGLSTGIGSLIALFARRTNTAFLSLALGFSAGVMIYVSMVEIFPEAQTIAISIWGDLGLWFATAAFFGGMMLIALIDRLVPSFENPHAPKLVEDLQEYNEEYANTKLLRTGVFAALAVAIHNFPEGIATFVAVLQDPSLGIAITIAIAIHNIPEGIAVSVPVFYSTGSRKKAFVYSFLSGLSEPLGALIAFLILMPFINEALFALLFASVAGIMVFVSLDELIPAAKEYDEAHNSIYGLIAGMMVMALSLLLMG